LVANTKWGIRLGPPQVLPTQTISVPGFNVHQPGFDVGLVSDLEGFHTQVYNLLASLHLSSHSLPIFVARDTGLLFPGNVCCEAGAHFAAAFANGPVERDVKTYIWASWGDPGNFAPAPDVRDVFVLSHEVAEWLNDPFVNNPVPGWVNQFFGFCQTNLE